VKNLQSKCKTHGSSRPRK